MIKRYKSQFNFLSKAVVANGMVYLSGMTAKDGSTDVAGQTAHVLSQIDDALAECGVDKSRIVVATIWLKDVSTFAEMNEAWLAWADHDALPARACVEAPLVRDEALVEIMIQAAI
tara:strand:+ start:389 stop:736 length:348 start_codon:yes stop_codon:yes gene_type:complete